MPAEQALEHWSDPKAYAAMREYWDFRTLPFMVVPGPPSEGELEYERRRRPLQEAFLDRLRSGELMASAIPEGADPTASRTLVDPEVFRHGSLVFEMETIVLSGSNKALRYVEIFEPPGVPRNIRIIPDWYREQFEPAQTAVQTSGAGAAEPQGEAGFRQEADYRRVWINGHEFRLTHLQAEVVKILHQEHLANGRWLSGKTVLHEAGSRSMQMFQVFRSQGRRWSCLIESDGDGRYRLNIRG